MESYPDFNWMANLEEAVDYCIHHREQSNWCNGIVAEAFEDEVSRLSVELYGDLGGTEWTKEAYYNSLKQKARDRIDEKKR